MLTTKYLYNIDATTLSTMPYKQALDYKVSNGIKNKKLIAREAATVIKNHTVYNLLVHKYLAVDKAIRFNKKLLQELQ